MNNIDRKDKFKFLELKPTEEIRISGRLGYGEYQRTKYRCLKLCNNLSCVPQLLRCGKVYCSNIDHRVSTPLKIQIRHCFQNILISTQNTYDLKNYLLNCD